MPKGGMDERKRRDPNKRFEAEQRSLEAKRRRREAEAERAERHEGRAGAAGHDIDQSTRAPKTVKLFTA